MLMLISCSYERILYDYFLAPLITKAFIPFPTLKKSSFFGFTSTSVPVFGFFPVYASWSLIVKLPKSLIVILPPFFSVFVNPLKISLMISVACFSDSFYLSARAVMRSDFVMMVVSRKYLIILIYCE